ncbi:MAG: DnaA regulatory inactivator Hda [Betaproteobacteria bacterium]|nr:DnaA regulatory inactivator Hda [Betaproteobacteria bacterium]
MRQLALDFAAPPTPTLDNFVPGRNAELLVNLGRLAAGASQERIFYLWGESGSGRTHLLRATVAALHSAGTSAAYVACGPTTGLRDGLDCMDCVALDDLDQLGAEGQETAFHLYNALRERGGALVASGAAPPVQLTLRGDLVTRLGWGLVYRVHGLSDAEKVRALTDHAAARGFPLLPEVGEYLLAHVRRDLPSLLAVLDALDRYSRETKRPVTVTLVRELVHAAGAQAAGSRIQGT